jgi:hypothetical protein
MFDHLEALLAENPALWNEGYLVFGHGPNTLAATDTSVVLNFFGPSRLVPARSGLGVTELLVTPAALRDIDPSYGRLALAQLLRDEARMFASEPVDSAVVWNIVNSFFSEFKSPRVFCNTSVQAVPLDATFFGGWNSATKHTKDTFLCAIDRANIAYWLTGDDE